MAFPTTFTNATDTVTEIVAAHLNNLETKVGIDTSADPASLDYKINNLIPSQTGNAGKFLKTDGSTLLFSAVAAGVDMIEVQVFN